MTKGLLRHYSPAARSLSNLSRPLRDRMELSQYLRWDHLFMARATRSHTKSFTSVNHFPLLILSLMFKLSIYEPVEGEEPELGAGGQQDGDNLQVKSFMLLETLMTCNWHVGASRRREPWRPTGRRTWGQPRGDKFYEI